MTSEELTKIAKRCAQLSWMTGPALKRVLRKEATWRIKDCASKGRILEAIIEDEFQHLVPGDH